MTSPEPTEPQLSEPPPTESQPAARRRVWPLAVAAGVALVVATAGVTYAVSSGSEPAVAPAAASSASATARPSADQFAQQACHANAAALDAIEGDSPAVMRPVADAAQKSATQSIARAGLFLSRQIDLAEEARGRSDEAAMGAYLTAESFRFATACAEAGIS